MKFIECKLKYSDSIRIKNKLIEQSLLDPVFKEKLNNWECDELGMIKLLATEAYSKKRIKIGKCECPLEFTIDEQVAYIIHCVDENITKDSKIPNSVKVDISDSNSSDEKDSVKEIISKKNKKEKIDLYNGASLFNYD